MPAFRIARLGLTRTFQVSQPFTHLTALENVAIGAMFGSKGGGRSAHQAMTVAQGVLDRVGLGHRAGALVEDFTVLDRKRLDLARALASEPKVLLLDEVLAGLRAGEMDEAVELVRSVNASGVTLVVIEHVLRVIVSLCDSVVVIDRGHKIADGTPDEVMHEDDVIKAYLGTARLEADRA
jgi:ABC-type branched-subunit amino acid transport system ATPase component